MRRKCIRGIKNKMDYTAKDYRDPQKFPLTTLKGCSEQGQKFSDMDLLEQLEERIEAGVVLPPRSQAIYEELKIKEKILKEEQSSG